jgi:formylglycine-generating enzyme
MPVRPLVYVGSFVAITVCLVLLPNQAAGKSLDCGEAPAGMSCVPGAEYTVGRDGDLHPDCDQHSFQRRNRSNTKGEHKVNLSPFFMDRTEVTNKAYRGCMRAGKCPKAGPNYRDFKRPNQPVTGVSWYDAVAFCKAQGKHLPSEAQWEAAARGPEGDLNPWGNEPATCDVAVIRDPTLGRSCGVKKLGGSPSKGRVLEVGSRPAGRYGLFDMVGNAEEWTADWYTDDWKVCGTACVGTDPKGPCQGEKRCKGHRYRTVRGGSWYWPANHATAVHRRPHKPSNKPVHHFGFRCAASVEEARRLLSSRREGK